MITRVEMTAFCMQYEIMTGIAHGGREQGKESWEKATREAEECFKTSAENKEDDLKEEFTTASLLKEQKALQQ